MIPVAPETPEHHFTEENHTILGIPYDTQDAFRLLEQTWIAMERLLPAPKTSSKPTKKTITLPQRSILSRFVDIFESDAHKPLGLEKSFLILRMAGIDNEWFERNYIDPKNIIPVAFRINSTDDQSLLFYKLDPNTRQIIGLFKIHAWKNANGWHGGSRDSIVAEEISDILAEWYAELPRIAPTLKSDVLDELEIAGMNTHWIVEWVIANIDPEYTEGEYPWLTPIAYCKEKDGGNILYYFDQHNKIQRIADNKKNTTKFAFTSPEELSEHINNMGGRLLSPISSKYLQETIRTNLKSYIE